MAKITREKYLAALGLFYIANKKAREVVTLDDEMNAILGLEPGSHVSDEIYDRDGSLDAALQREGIEFDALPPEDSPQ